MVKVRVGNNLKRETVIVDSSSTLRSCFEEAGMKLNGGVVTLDGAAIAPGDMNKTLNELGYTGEEGKNECILHSIAKADNA